MAVGQTNAMVRLKLQGKTVTPSTVDQSVVADSGYDGLSNVAVAGEPNLIASNIKQGVTMFGVVGSLSGEGGASTSGDYKVLIIDYDGTVIDEQWLNEDDEYEMPTPPSHNGLTFDGWSCSETITDGKITIRKQDVLAGATYYTTSGKVEIDIVVPQKTIPITCTASSTIDWGDGTVDNNTSHYYATAGKYTIKFIPTNNIIAFTGNYSYGITDYQYLIKEIRCSSDVTTVGNCNNLYCLNAISLPNSVTSFDTGYNFLNCDVLKAFIFPKDVVTLPNSVVQYCKTLKWIVFPKGVLTFNGAYGANCYALKDFIIIPDTITDINGSSLTLTIPSHIKIEGGNNLFWGKKKSISPELIGANIPEGVTSIGENSFYGTSNSIQIEKITLPSTLTSLGKKSFYNTMIKDIIVPQGVTSLLEGVFGMCMFLESINLPSGITSIGKQAFIGCKSLTKFEVPGSVTSIGSQAFYNCSNCSMFDFSNHQSVPSLSNSDAFTNINANAKIVVPDSLYSSWIAASNWSSLSSYIISATSYAAL